MHRILIALATLALAACAPKPLIVATPPEPIPVAIDASCFEPCAELPPWQPNADGTAPWAALGELAIADADIRNDCEARRAHCAAPLRRLIQTKVITVKAPEAQARDPP